MKQEVSSFKSPQQIARAQQRAFEHKPWQPGFPLKDVLGNSLCYRDDNAHIDARYWVKVEGERGAHIRQGIDGGFQAFGITRSEAESIGKQYAEIKFTGGFSARMEGCFQRADGYHVASFVCHKTIHGAE